MNFAQKAITTVAALAVITAGATVTPTSAQASDSFVNALVGGLIVGGIVAASQNRNYNNGYYNSGYQSCSTRWETRHNSWGQPYSVQVKYCY